MMFSFNEAIFICILCNISFLFLNPSPSSWGGGVTGIGSRGISARYGVLIHYIVSFLTGLICINFLVNMAAYINPLKTKCILSNIKTQGILHSKLSPPQFKKPII
jgi:hypothetical protein